MSKKNISKKMFNTNKFFSLSANNTPIVLSYIYLFLPFLIFLIGWVKPFIAIPSLIIALFVFCRMVKSPPELWIPSISRDSIVKLLFIFFIILVWVYLSGIGKFVAQNGDHNTRNVMFQMLVEEKWPIINLNPPSEYFQKPVAFVYYFGFWLPSAVIGKVFGMAAGCVAQVVWATIGIYLFYYLILAKYIKNIVFWPLLILIFFSGLDMLGVYLLGVNIFDLDSTTHLEWWATPFQYSSMTTQLFWVFNQSLPSWIALAILLIQKDNKFIAVIIALNMITSTLPFIGLMAISACIISNAIAQKRPPVVNKQSLWVVCKEILTFENIIGGGIIGILSFLFLRNNNAAQHISFVNYNSQKGIILLWLLFFFAEAGLYFISIYKYQKNNYLFYVSLLSLMITPWIQVGNGSDFCMRVSIPALTLLYCLVVDTLSKGWERRDYRSITVIVTVLIIGSFTPINEITRTTSETVSRERAGMQIEIEPIHPMAAGWRDNFYGYIENSIFFDYFVKNAKDD